MQECLIEELRRVVDSTGGAEIMVEHVDFILMRQATREQIAQEDVDRLNQIYLVELENRERELVAAGLQKPARDQRREMQKHYRNIAARHNA